MPGAETAASLRGARVLVTRPTGQAETLCRMIAEAGGTAVSVPVMEMVAVDSPVAREHIQGLDGFDIAVFISANAVEWARRAGAPFDRWPTAVQVAAVGAATAAGLQSLGVRVDLRPEQDFSSEGLLALGALQAPEGKRILIFRGVGGRETLARTLRHRGAEVHYAEVYRRRIPEGSRVVLDQVVRGDTVDAIVVTSDEGLRNLYQIAGHHHRAWLLAKALVVMSRRSLATAIELGFAQTPWVAATASDRGLVEALKQWYAGRGKKPQ